MMLRKSTVATLSILVAVATALPYSEWNHARYRWNDLFAARGQEVAATVVTSACATITKTMDGKSYTVRVCKADPEDSPSKVCLGTRVNPCCPAADFGKGNLVSSNKVNVAGEDVTVTYYLTQDSAERICFRLDEAHQRSDTCSRSRIEGDSCLSPCSTITTTCFNNTETGDSSSCNGNVCRCKTGYLAPDCCQCDITNFYLPDCKPFCRDNCRRFRPNNLGGCLTCRAGYIGAPECCECEPGKTEVNGECKCNANLNPDGTCAEGALEPDCCECDTTGNATHAFYKTASGECKPFCPNNCASNTGFGCDTCKTGFMSPRKCCQCEPGREEVNGICKCSANLNPDGSCIPEAKPEDCCECITDYQKGPSGRCEPEKCDKQQKLFFYIDATASNIFENFCPLMVVIQMLVAAFNPSATTGTQISSLLFSDNVKNKPPSPVFNMGTSCFNAVQGPDKSLSSLMIDFGVCLDNGRTGYDSVTFPSSCGEGTSAVKGLREIYNIASTTRSSTEGAILMLTDGIILDNASERTKVLSDLTSAGISTLIAAGIGEADVENLKLYTSDNNILVGNDPIQLGIDIVNKMQERGIVCKDHADNITRSLNNAQGGDLISNFCRCHRKRYIGRDICQRKYPTCGGDISIGLPNLPGNSAKTQDVEALNQLLMEEEILAAVEKVLEQRYG